MKIKSSIFIARDILFFKSINSSFEKEEKPFKSFIFFISELIEKLKILKSLTLDSIGLTKYFFTLSISSWFKTLSKIISFPLLTVIFELLSKRDTHWTALSALWSYWAGNVS